MRYASLVKRMTVIVVEKKSTKDKSAPLVIAVRAVVKRKRLEMDTKLIITKKWIKTNGCFFFFFFLKTCFETRFENREKQRKKK